MWRIAILVCSLLLTPAHAKEWRKQTITGVGFIDWAWLVILNDEECFMVDDHAKTWKVGDEILVTDDRSELINQSRGNEGAEIAMEGEDKCEL